MQRLSSLSLWHRVVGLTLVFIALLYLVDLTVVPIESKSQYFRFNPFSSRDDTSCYGNLSKSGNLEHLSNLAESPKQLSNEITENAADSVGRRPGGPSKPAINGISNKFADDTGGLPVQELLHVTEINSGETAEVPTTSHYHNSTWKPEIGYWLEKCGEAAPFLVPEQFANRVCEHKCQGRGVCNHDFGECRCYHGYTGRGCEVEQQFVCSDNETEKWTAIYGSWRVSICGAYCDKKLSFCYCGEGTKYPQRPVAESCGFSMRDDRVDWDAPDPSIFSNDNESIGWCNLSIQDLDKFEKKPNCGCIYDGTGGDLCEVPVESFCINQCSGNGRCRGGSCACVEGWHGIDCSIPSSLSSLQRWPHWLRPGVLKMTDVSESWQQETLEVVVERRRPLIYVYELPAKFNSHLLEGRHYRNHCVNRIYDLDNRTIWIDDLYGSEVAILESLLSSAYRTSNAEEADFFYVPVLGACAIIRADEAPHMNIQTDFLGLRTYFSGELYREAFEYIRDTYPYWNQTEGRDHMWLFPWDEGACAAPKEIWNSMMLVHWGNTNSKHNYSTTAYSADSWNDIPSEWRGNHPCYDPAKDLVLPAWKVPDPTFFSIKPWARTRKERPTLFYFNGNLGDMYEGRPEAEYSMGLRQRLAEEFGSHPNKNLTAGRQTAPDVTVVSTRSESYGMELSQSRFCGVLPGDGWSGRMEDSILHGCIPVIIQDGIHLPFESVLNYDEFSLRVAERDLPQLITILRNVTESRVDSMLSAIQGLWQRFTYISAVQLEGKREIQKHGEAYADWIQQYMNASGDDAFSTFIQVLHFKLYNRTWTKTTTNIDSEDFSRKDYCSKKIPL
ncbi:protein MpGT47.12 [Marchantia polymorpha subsp. ruderalis]